MPTVRARRARVDREVGETDCKALTSSRRRRFSSRSSSTDADWAVSPP
jgi:hypothetical protein